MGFGNFSLVSGARFSPFSYLELLSPVLMATQAHQLLEDAYGELGTLASIWEGMIDLNLDPELYAQQLAYAKALNDLVESLARQGLSPTSRREMLNMKLRYAREINPIEIAYKKREADIERQKKMLDSTSGAAIFTRNARNTSLKDYIDGVDDYGLANLNELFKEGAAGAAAISSRYINTLEGKLFNNMYLNLKVTKGMSDDLIALFLSNERDSNGNLLFPNLHNLKNEIMAKYNSGAFSAEDLGRMSNAILQGINTGIVYSEDNKPMENWRYKMLEQHRLTMEEKEAEERKKAAAAKLELVKAANPRSLLTKDELNDFSSLLKSVDKWVKEGYIKKKPDGTFVLMKKGLDYANETFDVASRHTGITTNWKDQLFRDFLVKSGAIEDKAGKLVRLGNGKSGFRLEYKLKGYDSKELNRLMKILESGYDATRSTEFTYQYGTNAELERAKDMIRTALGNSGALIYSFKGKDLGYTSDNKTIDKDDFVKNYTVLANKGSKYGLVFVVEDKNGNQYNIRVPEVNREQENSAMRYYAAAEHSLAQIYNMDMEILAILQKADNNFNNLSVREQNKLRDYYAYRQTYEDNIWEAQQALGRITRGFKTDNVLIK